MRSRHRLRRMQERHRQNRGAREFLDWLGDLATATQRDLSSMGWMRWRDSAVDASFLKRKDQARSPKQRAMSTRTG
jgi:hypothetical protein